jgi:phosphate uptake regulator
MERKLIQQGGGGYTIYLPKHWVEKKGLERGAKVQIAETETSLVISSSVAQKQAITIKVTPENKRDLRNILTHLYRRGFDSITFTGADEQLAGEIERVTADLLLGFEVTEREGGKCRLENLSEPSEDKYELLLKRLFLIIKEVQRLLSEDVTKGGYSHLQEVERLRLQHDKYLLFCRRSLIKERGERSISTQWELLTFLMHICHACYYAYRYAAERKVKPTARIDDLLNEAQQYFDLYYDAFYKRDIAAVHRINVRRDDLLLGKCYDYLRESRGNETIVLSHLRELLRLIQIGMSPILSELLEAELA